MGKHRLRFIRHTIKVAMGGGNWGIASQYLELLIKHAKKNRKKLEDELAVCRKNGCTDTPAAQKLPSAVVGATAMGAFTCLSEAAEYSLSEALASKDPEGVSGGGADAIAMASDLACLGLASFLDGDVRKGEQSLRDCLAVQQQPVAAQASCLCSLSLMYMAKQTRSQSDLGKPKGLYASVFPC